MKRLTFLITVVFCLVIAGSVLAERWPIGDGSTAYPLGNNYGEYQNYGGSPYYHDGIDILGYVGEPNYPVSDVCYEVCRFIK